MTEKEAMDRLTKSAYRTTCYGNRVVEHEENLVAIKALEKQIAKKPNYEGNGYYNGELVYDTWICPCCEKQYEVDYDDYDYCPSCGQKIEKID